MSAQMERPADEELLFQPTLSINGLITPDTVPFALGRLEDIRTSGKPLIVELNTDGGDADAARRIALEVRLFREHSSQPAYCVGKSNVYSAGVTILAAFPRDTRFLTEDAILLIHERRLESSIELNGPIRSCLQIVREQLSLLETAQDLEMTGLQELVEGSDLTVDELYEMATKNCYMKADKALEHSLIGGILA
ncbi:MAG: peptidase S14 [Verrucomicrobiaceae bacterium]|nr:MAG: peptidase S14 [Verrucomicrobiaceae bacterium]